MGNSQDVDTEPGPHRMNAAAWYVRFVLARHPRDLASFSNWLEESPDNRASFDTTQAALKIVDAVADEPEILALRRAALARTDASRKGRWFKRPQASIATAASLLLCLVGTWFLSDRSPQTAVTVIQTNPDGGRVVKLSDGSRVTLDRRTRLTISYSEARRDISLIGGQARFQVAHDVSRPFVVTVGLRSVRAIGTDFNVERPAGSTIITLIEGGVVVAPASEAGGRHRQRGVVELRPGDQLKGRDDGGQVVRRVHLQDVVAWQQGKLSFNNERLSSAIGRINRYSKRKLVADDDIAELRVNGVFNLDDSPAFAEAASLLLPVEISKGPNGMIRLRKRSDIKTSLHQKEK